VNLTAINFEDLDQRAKQTCPYRNKCIIDIFIEIEIYKYSFKRSIQFLPTN